MRALLLPSLACLSLILSGCSAVNSAHPLYTSEDAVQEPALVGTWISDDKDMPEFVFQKSDGNAYNMVLTDEESKTVYLYEVHLVRLEDQTFMDIVFRKQTVNGTEAGEAAEYLVDQPQMRAANRRIRVEDHDFIEECVDDWTKRCDQGQGFAIRALVAELCDLRSQRRSSIRKLLRFC